MSQSRKNNDTYSDDAKKPARRIYESVAIGSAAGAAEVAIDHPLWVYKTMRQAGMPIKWNRSILSVLYKGIVPNIASMVPITGCQVGMNQAFQNALYDNTVSLSVLQKLTSAFCAGVGSSPIGCTVEMIMTQQSKNKSRFVDAAKQAYSAGGVRGMLTGITATAGREGIFTAFFLGATPALKSCIQPYISDDTLSTLSAGIGAGVAAGVLSHPLDTVKTVQQSSYPEKRLSLREAIKQVHASHGYRGLFRSMVPRGARVVSGLTIMSAVAQEVEKHLLKK